MATLSQAKRPEVKDAGNEAQGSSVFIMSSIDAKNCQVALNLKP